MLRRLLAAVEMWFYGTCDRISALFTDEAGYPEESVLGSPALVPVSARSPQVEPASPTRALAS
jgi:hypothetical protein